jgi:hypothetical protein
MLRAEVRAAARGISPEAIEILYRSPQSNSTIGAALEELPQISSSEAGVAVVQKMIGDEVRLDVLMEVGRRADADSADTLDRLEHKFEQAQQVYHTVRSESKRRRERERRSRLGSSRRA